MGEGGNIQVTNPVKNPALPFIKKPQYVLTAGSVIPSGDSKPGSNLANPRKSQIAEANKNGKGGSRLSVDSRAQPRSRAESKISNVKAAPLEDDEMVVFSPVEEVVRTGVFVDASQRNKIVAKPIVNYNPLTTMKATMAVTVWENEQMTQVGDLYKSGASMTRGEFEKLKALG